MAQGAVEPSARRSLGVSGWVRGFYSFITDRNDFRRNLIVNTGLFAAGVWMARNLSDIDLMAPPPGL
ncbi:mitochondrial import receptor subunit TOM6 homolog [Spea bombifrons]|uniref:mitochondrial import receptor subunit TOM6 homolog n=1 Tax=Spea bombifrons TaxID=233779 RepID=UPI00234A92B8|nr:mitochondrial import receptor subunit TOM6 homolog [Spea bombifrons]